jgi:flagellar basal-body rod protein FlgB
MIEEDADQGGSKVKMVNDFTKTVDLLQRSMDASVIRREVIANNIANADVPNFKRTTVNFESELKRALDSADNKPVLDLALTNPKHIPNWRELDYQSVQPRRVLDYVSTAKNNGNNVDPEEEMMAALNNQLMYTLMAQAQTFEFGQINLVLR